MNEAANRKAVEPIWCGPMLGQSSLKSSVCCLQWVRLHLP